MSNSIVQQSDKLVRLTRMLASNEVNNNSIQKVNQTGTITSIIDANNNLYEVKIDGETFQIYARENLTLSVGNIVIISLYNGDINKRIIDFKKPKNW
jgi:membrane protein implicated in regulation of membrane protease activity